MRLAQQTRRGFTLVEIMIVVAIIGILIAIAVPGFVKARTESRRQACSENLVKIDGAKEVWTLLWKVAPGTPVDMTDIYTDDGSSYLKNDPVCPTDGLDYTVNAVGVEPVCTGGHLGHEMP